MSPLIVLDKVISGGQTGVDQAALNAAKDFGIPTGGWMPRGFRTLEGSRRDFVEKFGIQEHSAFGYGPRTRANVRDSDGTVRIALCFNSPGEKCTLSHIQLLHRPSLDIPVVVDYSGFSRLIVSDSQILILANFIEEHQIKVLNIAGNSERTAPGIYNTAYYFLLRFFALRVAK